MQVRQVVRNAAMSILQVLVIGGVYFVLYKVLLGTIGIDALGIWSVVLAATSVGRISQLGIGPSVVKFVAQRVAQGDRAGVVPVIHTGVLFIGGFMAVVILAFWPFAGWLLGLVVPEAKIDAALALLPWALGSLWVTTIAGVYQAGLDGFQRVDLRSSLVMGSTVLYLVLCLALVPDQGLLGLAIAQVAQSVVLLVAVVALLRRQLPSLPLLPTRFSKERFREMLGYGLNVQAMSICAMLLEPVTKGLLSKFGGLSMVGWFEMANRMTVQIRSLLNSATEALVPTFANLQEQDPAAVQRVYLEAYRFVLFLVLPTLAFTIVVTPLVSEAWIGHYEPAFATYAYLLSTGLLLALVSTPAYYANLGLGTLTWNSLGLLTILVGTIVVSLALGPFLGGTGVVVAFAASYVAGSASIVIPYHRRHGIRLSESLPRESLLLALASAAGTASGLALYYGLRPRVPLVGLTAAVLAAFALLALPPAWAHPMRHRVMALAKRVVGR